MYSTYSVIYLNLRSTSITNTVVGSQRQCFTSPLWRREAELSSQRFHSPSNQKLAVFSTGISGAFLIAEFVRIDLTDQMFCLFSLLQSKEQFWKRYLNQFIVNHQIFIWRHCVTDCVKAKWWLDGLADAPSWLSGALRGQVDWQQVDSLAWAGSPFND